jgi:hypothetical protein
MHPARIGNGVQICSVYNFQILFRGFFFSGRRASPNDAGSFGASMAVRGTKERKKICAGLPRSAYSWGHRLLILVYLAKRKYIKIKDDSKIK